MPASRLAPGRLSDDEKCSLICGWIIWMHWSWLIPPVRQILNGLLLRQFRPDDIRRGGGVDCRHRVDVVHPGI